MNTSEAMSTLKRAEELLAEREKWLMRKAFIAGWDTNELRDPNRGLDEWLSDMAADGVTVEMVLAEEAPPCDMCAEVKALREENATLRTTLSGRTYCHSDEAVNAELKAASVEAESLAKAIYRRRYAEESPNWGLCDTTAGVISQINNMVAGLFQDIEQRESEITSLRGVVEKVREEKEAEALLRQSAVTEMDSWRNQFHTLQGAARKAEKQIRAIPVRVEFLGGQRTKYVQREEVLSLLSEVPK